jgi:exo-1,4-beta-D-glucosaminidase
VSQLADMSALNAMPGARVVASGQYYTEPNHETRVQIKLANTSNHVAFFLRAEITKDADGEEILPIRYDDNYITLFPQEARAVDARFDDSLITGHKPGLRLEGYDVPKQLVALTEGTRE